MKIRIKFSKQGRIKFVGHLDLLRLFQRVIKSANIPIAYSKGFNPHPLLYFAQALSVGITSEGEYLDLHLVEAVDPAEVKKHMNSILPEGLEIKHVSILAEESKTCMALVDLSRYTITTDKTPDNKDFLQLSRDFYNQKEIPYTRVSKKKERIINIKEFIHDLEIYESKTQYILSVDLAAGSRKNLNSKLFIEAFRDHSKLAFHYAIHRKELFSLQDEQFIPLWKLGV